MLNVYTDDANLLHMTLYFFYLLKNIDVCSSCSLNWILKIFHVLKIFNLSRIDGLGHFYEWINMFKMIRIAIFSIFEKRFFKFEFRKHLYGFCIFWNNLYGFDGFLWNLYGFEYFDGICMVFEKKLYGFQMLSLITKFKNRPLLNKLAHAS